MKFSRSGLESLEGDMLLAGEKTDWQVLGLERDPFPVYLESKVDYVPQQWEQSLDLLQHLIRSSNVLLAVTGERGIGKTTLLNRFLLEAVHDSLEEDEKIEPTLLDEQLAVFESNNLRVCKTHAEAGFDSQRLLDLITESFSLPWQSMDLLEEQFDAQVENLQQCDFDSLLVIDDAHLLPNDTLESLLYMIGQQSETQMRFHIVLFGESSLKDQLMEINEYQGTSDLTCILEVEPLTREETEQYLHHRLSDAGLEGALPLSSTDIARVYKLSRGVPSQINRVARQILLDANHGHGRWQRSPWGGRLREHQTKLLGGTLVAIVVGFVVFKLMLTEQQPVRLTAAPVSVATPVQPVNQTTIVTNAAAVTPSQAIDTSARITPVTTSVMTEAQVPSSETITATAVTQTEQPLQQPVSHLGVAQLTRPQQMPAAAAIPLQNNAVTRAEAEEVVVPEDVTTLQQSDQAIVYEAATAQRSAATKVPTEAPKAATKTPPIVNREKQKQHFSVSEKRLLKTQSTYFTLQLVGLRDEQKLKQLIQQYQLGDKAAYYHTHFQGKDWFVLLYGQFNSSVQAHAEVAKLPKVLRDLKPWVRDFASVHHSIRGGGSTG